MPYTTALPLPTIIDIRKAAETLQGEAIITPLLESSLLNEKLGGRLLIKPECLQRTGSFKFRGAFNCISNLNPETLSNGVVAFSSGNHAQGVAAAAQGKGIPATIIMPQDAPAMKIANTKAYGAEVVTYDRYTESREEIGEKITKERGAALVRPYDDFYVIAGQGTVGLELAAQAKVKTDTLDAVLVPCSGGGLVGGTSIAIKEQFPDARIYAAEPDGYDDTKKSLAAGERIAVDATKKSMCDALLMTIPGELTFAINVKNLEAGVSISDAEALHAMAVAFEYFKIVVEPGGAAALAAVLSGRVSIKGQTIAVVCSGGNVDPEVFRQALASN